MASPEDFDVVDEYSDNLSMRKNNRPEQPLATAQWQTVRDSLSIRGVQVGVAPRAEGCADYMFYANAGLPLPGGKTFILSSFRHAQRDAERPHIKRFLESNDYEVLELGTGEIFEGQGDAFFWEEDILFICWGIRTNLAGAHAVRNLVRKINPRIRVEFLEMMYVVIDGEHGQRSFYHGDMPLLRMPRRRQFLVYGPSFKPPAVRKCREYGAVHFASEELVYNFALNGLEISADTVMTSWPGQKLQAGAREQLEKLGYSDIAFCSTTEAHKSGGGTKCMALELFEPLT